MDIKLKAKMIIPQPLPDEICLGHIGRIKRLNSCKKNVFEAIPNLVLKSGGDKHHFDLLGTVAKLCGIRPLEYASLHSFVPFFMCKITGYKSMSIDQRVQRLIRLDGSNMPLKHASFCEICIDEDLRFRSYSYWRRSHQIPGMLWCQKHGNLLHRCPLLGVFNRTPAEYLDKSEKYSDICGKTINDAPFLIQKYLEICTQFIESSVLIEAGKVSAHLKEFASLYGISINKDKYAPKRLRDESYSIFVNEKSDENITGKKLFLSDLIVKKFPMHWLESAFPLLKSKVPGQFIQSIDDIFKESNVFLFGHNVVIALVMMFEKPDEQLSRFVNSDGSLRLLRAQDSSNSVSYV